MDCSQLRLGQLTTHLFIKNFQLFPVKWNYRNKWSWSSRQSLQKTEFLLFTWRKLFILSKVLNLPKMAKPEYKAIPRDCLSKPNQMVPSHYTPPRSKLLICRSSGKLSTWVNSPRDRILCQGIRKFAASLKALSSQVTATGQFHWPSLMIALTMAFFLWRESPTHLLSPYLYCFGTLFT